MYNHTIEDIKLKVLGENEVNKVLNIVNPIIKNRLKDYLGIKILKVNQELIKELKEDIDKILNSEKDKISINPYKKGDYAKIQVLYLSSSHYDLKIEISINFSGGNYEDKTYYCYYHKKTSYICSLENSQIKQFYDFIGFKSINTEQQIKQVEKCIKLLEELNQEKNQLFPYELREFVR
jgi:hypothetical protein